MPPPMGKVIWDLTVPKKRSSRRYQVALVYRSRKKEKGKPDFSQQHYLNISDNSEWFNVTCAGRRHKKDAQSVTHPEGLTSGWTRGFGSM